MASAPRSCSITISPAPSPAHRKFRALICGIFIVGSGRPKNRHDIYHSYWRIVLFRMMTSSRPSIHDSISHENSRDFTSRRHAASISTTSSSSIGRLTVSYSYNVLAVLKARRIVAALHASRGVEIHTVTWKSGKENAHISTSRRLTSGPLGEMQS